jgi:peroxiredoxin
MMAPDFQGRDTAGGTFRLGDHLGKEVILLDFWATYCDPCRAELPHLSEMMERDRSKGLLVVGVAVDGPGTSDDVSAFVRRFALDFPVVLDEDAHIGRVYDPRRWVPLSILIDRTGHITAVHEGYAPGDERLVDAEVAGAL